MMVGGLRAPVEAHESADRRPVGEAHDVGWNDAERVHIPARGQVEVRRLDHHVAEFGHLRRLERGTLCVVDPNCTVWRVVGNGRPHDRRLDRDEAPVDAHLVSVRVAQSHDRSSSRAVEGLDGRAARRRKRFEVGRHGHGKPEPQKARILAARDPIDERGRTRTPQEQLGFAPRGDDKPEIGEIVLGFPEVGALEKGVEQGVGLRRRRGAARQDDASGSGPGDRGVIHWRFLSFGWGQAASRGSAAPGKDAKGVKTSRSVARSSRSAMNRSGRTSSPLAPARRAQSEKA